MLLLLLLLPTVALASMEVKIYGTLVSDSTYIIQGDMRVEGSEKWAITDNDRVAFRIQEEDLKSAIETYYGKRPDHVFFTRDTPWGDLHNQLGLNPVELKIEPDTIRPINESESKKVVIHQNDYENPTKETEKILITQFRTTYERVVSLWNNPSNFSVNNIDVKFILNLKVEKDVKIVDHKFGFGIERKTLPKKSRTQSRSIDLAPGQKVLAQLEVKKKSLTFEIVYKVSLAGGVTVNYNEKYKNSNFHGWDINQLLENRTILIAQTILYDFYYDQSLNIIDPKDGQVLNSFPEEFGTGSGHKRRASAAVHATATGDKIARKAPRMPVDFTEEDLKSVVEDTYENNSNEESSESSEQTTEKPEEKTLLEAPKSE